VVRRDQVLFFVDDLVTLNEIVPIMSSTLYKILELQRMEDNEGYWGE